MTMHEMMLRVLDVWRPCRTSRGERARVIYHVMREYARRAARGEI